MYLTYEEYTSMGGTLDESVFNDFEFEAEELINWYTFNRLEKEATYPDKVKRCVFKLIGLLKLKADSMTLGQQTDSNGNITTSGAIQSQANDGVNISYNAIAANEMFSSLNLKTPNNEFTTTIKLYLNGVTNSLGQKVLYRGMYPNE